MANSVVKNVDKKERVRNPAAPFITSTTATRVCAQTKILCAKNHACCTATL